MRWKEHLFIGLVVACLIAFVLDGFVIGPSLGYAIIGGIVGSKLPDYIEPPRHHRHRKFFHSKRFLKALGLLMLVSLPISFFIGWVWLIFYAIVGYVMHLLADWTTPLGLPD